MNILDFDFNNKEMVERIRNFSKILPISEGMPTQYFHCLDVEISLHPDCYILSPKETFLSIYNLHLNEKDLDPNIPVITYSQLLLCKLTDKAILDRCKAENRHLTSNPFRYIIERIKDINSLLLIDTIGGAIYYKDNEGNIESLDMTFWNIEEAFFSMRFVVGSLEQYRSGFPLTEEMRNELESYGITNKIVTRKVARTVYLDNFVKQHNKLPSPLISCDKKEADIIGFRRNFELYTKKVIRNILNPDMFDYEINK